ncbi:uncharacterized protein [Glycine max]|uniref:uncharacterized protein n=1 Tax=Glycine max TaxID=3847 RepID=UPI001B3565E7|nr:uncharacterized protein LOC121174625 [Glycine max]
MSIMKIIRKIVLILWLQQLLLLEFLLPVFQKPGHINGGEISVSMDRNMCDEEVINTDSGDKLGNSTGAGNSNFHEDGPEPSLSDDCATSGKDHNEQISSTSTLGKATNSSLKTDAINDLH